MEAMLCLGGAMERIASVSHFLPTMKPLLAGPHSARPPAKTAASAPALVKRQRLSFGGIWDMALTTRGTRACFATSSVSSKVRVSSVRTAA